MLRRKQQRFLRKIKKVANKPEKKTEKETPVTLVTGVPGRSPHAVHKVFKNNKGEVKVQQSGSKVKKATFPVNVKNVKQGVKTVQKNFSNRKMG